MVYLWYGPDSYAKREKIQELAKKLNTSVVFFNQEQELPALAELTSQGLFGKSPVYVIEDGIKRVSREKELPFLVKSSAHIVLFSEKIDKRLKESSQWLKEKNIEIEQLEPPTRERLPEWIEEYCKKNDIKMSRETINILATRLYPLVQSFFSSQSIDLWRVVNEISKLRAFAYNRQITKEDVFTLVYPDDETESIEVVSALADRDLNKAFTLFERYLNTTAVDRKTRLIQLNAALAEQVRALLLVKDALNKGLKDKDIFEWTSWKPGRLFILKKIAVKFNIDELDKILQKNYLLDIELKSSNMPAQVIFQLIAAQL